MFGWGNAVMYYSLDTVDWVTGGHPACRKSTPAITNVLPL